MAGLSEGAARRSASTGTPSVRRGEASHGQAHLETRVYWVHRDSPNQPLDIQRARFPVDVRRAINRGEEPNILQPNCRQRR